MEWECFLLTKSNSTSDDAFMCVEAITPLTLPKMDLAATCAFNISLVKAYLTLIHLAEIWMILSHPDQSQSQFPLKCPCCQEAQSGKHLWGNWQMRDSQGPLQGTVTEGGILNWQGGQGLLDNIWMPMSSHELECYWDGQLCRVGSQIQHEYIMTKSYPSAIV